ncbi:MAG: phage holin family protein [Polyangiaceae bacterium]|nr:phage holin family protein [Polyangiaceae bacterium]
MLTLLISLLFSALALGLAAGVFKNIRLQGDFATLLMVAAGYQVLNFLLEKLLVGLIGLATLGLGFIFLFATHLVAAALLLRLTAGFSRGFEIKGFPAAFGAAVFLAIASEIAARISL